MYAELARPYVKEVERSRLLGRFGSINNSWGPSGVGPEESGLG